MFLEDLLFPKFCLGCNYLGCYICPKCAKQLKLYDRQRCLYCNKESYLGLTHPSCIRKLNIDGLISILHYNNFLKRIIKNIKYRLATEVFRELTQNIKPAYLEELYILKKIIPDAYIQPIPLSEKKKKARGFNQAEIIGKYFQGFLGFEMTDFLIRTQDRNPQAQMDSAEKRYLNVKGVFALKPKSIIANKRFLLIDDVVTTGSTVREAARIFKNAGADKVFVLALVRG
jgi:competence protein ComFC